MKSGDHGNSHFAEEIAPAHQLRGIFFWLERKRSEQHRQAATAKGLKRRHSVGGLCDNAETGRLPHAYSNFARLRRIWWCVRDRPLPDLGAWQLGLTIGNVELIFGKLFSPGEIFVVR